MGLSFLALMLARVLVRFLPGDPVSSPETQFISGDSIIKLAEGGQLDAALKFARFASDRDWRGQMMLGVLLARAAGDSARGEHERAKLALRAVEAFARVEKLGPVTAAAVAHDGIGFLTSRWGIERTQSWSR